MGTALILEPCDTASHDILRQVAEVKLGHADRKYSEDELIGAARDVDALLITSRDGVSRRVMEQCPWLRIIAKYGAKPHNVDIAAATELGIAVTYTPGSNPVSVAEHTLMMILALLKRLVPTMDAQKRGTWRNELAPASELQGKVVGIVGLGQIGSEVAKRLGCFGVELMGYDPYVPPERAAALGVSMAALEMVVRSADVVTLHCELTEQSRHLLNRERLRQMKPSAYLVNTARGGLVDTKALCEALSTGVIAGAAIDVFEDEPTTADHPLFALDNAIVTPHMAGVTHEAIAREPVWAADDVVRMLRGEPPKHLLNPGYERNVGRAGR